MPKKLPNGLTVMQDRFARLVGKGGKHGDSAIEAGYSARSAGATAARLLRNDKVQAVVMAVAQAAADRVDLDAATILQGLLDNARVGAERQPATSRDGSLSFDPESGALLTKPIDLSSSNAAYGLLGKHLRLFVDRTEIAMSEDAKAYLDRVVDIIDRVVTDPATRAALVEALAQDAGLT